MPWVIHCRYCFASIRSKHLFAAPSSLEIQNWRLENQAHGISGGCARSSILRASRRHGSGRSQIMAAADPTLSLATSRSAASGDDIAEGRLLLVENDGELPSAAGILPGQRRCFRGQRRCVGATRCSPNSARIRSWRAIYGRPIATIASMSRQEGDDDSARTGAKGDWRAAMSHRLAMRKDAQISSGITRLTTSPPSVLVHRLFEPEWVYSSNTR